MGVEAVEPRLLLSVATTEVLTYHNNNARTGGNLTETTLTPTNVDEATFGKKFSVAVDGYVFAQPLTMSDVEIPGKGIHNIVIVATAHNSVYAFDADQAGEPLWHTSFIDPANGITSVPTTENWQLDVFPEIGITGTPVIDRASGTLYVAAKTQITTPSGKREEYALHALDVSTGKEKAGSPVVINASVPGRGKGSKRGRVAFQPYYQLQRPALLLDDGVVYIAFGSLGAFGPYHGWVMGYSASTLKQVAVFNDTPNSQGANGSLGGIWMTGGGPVADATGHIYVMTGAGEFNASNRVRSFGNTILKLTPRLRVADYFAPQNAQQLGLKDKDLGSGGLVLAPVEPGSSATFLVGGGKEGLLFSVKTASMGRQRLRNPNVTSISTASHAIFSSPAYFNGMVYLNAVGDVLKQFKVVNGTLIGPVASSTKSFGYPGATPSISADGSKHGIVWTVQKTGTREIAGPPVLHAYDAADVGRLLYSSATDPARDTALGSAVKFVVPTVANGKVYVGSQGGLTVYGLLN